MASYDISQLAKYIQRNMNDLRTYFEENNGNCVDKWLHYFEIYDFWFKKYRNKPVVILEIGVYQGGSLKMWREYFGEKALIYAIDINPACKQFESKNTSIFIGSQQDRLFLQEVKSKMPKVDILIDDGGHTMEQQIISFEELYEHVKDDGLYLCEDLHTSYWKNYGGGYKKKGSFIEYSKNLVDQLNAWHTRSVEFTQDNITKSTYSLHFYTSVLLIEKRKISAPVSQRRGKMIIPTEDFPAPVTKRNFFQRLWSRVQKRMVRF